MKNRILLADEDEPVRKMVARVLEASGYVVMLASSGREAVQLWGRAQPDLVLLEVGGSALSDWGPVEEIRRLAPTTPIIGLTAWSHPTEEPAAHHMDALLEKPLDLSLLLQTMERLLGVPAEEWHGGQLSGSMG